VSGRGVHPSILTIRCRDNGVCSILNTHPVMQFEGDHGGQPEISQWIADAGVQKEAEKVHLLAHT
jgi:hypothetical protein